MDLDSAIPLGDEGEEDVDQMVMSVQAGYHGSYLKSFMSWIRLSLCMPTWLVS